MRKEDHDKDDLTWKSPVCNCHRSFTKDLGIVAGFGTAPGGFNNESVDTAVAAVIGGLARDEETFGAARESTGTAVGALDSGATFGTASLALSQSDGVARGVSSSVSLLALD